MKASPPYPGERTPVAKGYRDGTHRAVAPAETVERLRPLLAELGITRVANVTGLDDLGIPVVMVCRPNARSLAVSQGKGLSLAAAKASGLMESVELWHAERILSPLWLASLTELRQVGLVVDVERLARPAGSRFSDDLPLLWLEGRDLTSGEPTFVPYETVHTNATLPAPPGDGCFLSSSNGLASGNDLLEATSHALCELVERDATTLWRLGGDERLEQTLLDLDTVGDPACRELLDRCAASGVTVLAWETTSDVGLASFSCLLTSLRATQRHLRSAAMGFGCHPDRRVAFLRALTEAAQSRLTLIAGSRDDLFRYEYEDTLHTRESLERYRALAAIAQPPRCFQEVPSYELESFDEDVALALERLRAVGIEQVVAVDLTVARLAVPVVRVVAPGLEGPDEVPGYLGGARAAALLAGAR